MTNLRIGILGTGTLATALGTAWRRAGHEVTIGGRSPGKTRTAADAISGTAAEPAEVVRDRDAVLLAVLWPGVDEMLQLAGATDGSLDGTTLIDPTNAVQHGVGVLLPDRSAAEHIAARAPGASVVKAFALFPSNRWLHHDQRDGPTTVAICGDDPDALRVTSQLVADVGGTPAVLGGLDRARQLEEVSGFTIGLAFSGFSPATALPHIPA
jgi:predicted dinucleotide-binding enzyme